MREISRLARRYKVPVTFTKLINHAGHTSRGKIRLDNSKVYSRLEQLSTFFHELGHLHCHRNGIWKRYHWLKYKLDRRWWPTIIRIGLKAERWIDRWAAKEMRKWYPNLSYITSYGAPSIRKWYHEKVLIHYR
jgi:hypothetical protein